MLTSEEWFCWYKVLAGVPGTPGNLEDILNLFVKNLQHESCINFGWTSDILCKMGDTRKVTTRPRLLYSFKVKYCRSSN